jgi:hypothetical protein
MDLNNNHIIDEPSGEISTLELEADVQANLAKDKPRKKPSPPKKELDLLTDMLEISNRIEEAATGDIVSLPPVMLLDGRPIIKQNSINLIQGSYGSHKSRLAENLVASLIAKDDCTTDFWGFEKNPNETFAVAYIDTERNIREELPRALQTIRRLAGCKPRKKHPRLHLHSIKKYDRSIRQDATQLILSKIRQDTAHHHLVVVLDVITDCLNGFNDDKEAVRLYDFLGNLCEDHDCTVIAVIHENPNSNKARGHVGTEGANKSSTVFKIGYEKGQDGKESDFIKLEFLKLRHGKKPSPIYLRFCEEASNLVEASKEELEAAGITSSTANSTDEFPSLVSEAFANNESIPRSELLKYLTEKMKKSERTVDKYLKRLMANENTWVNNAKGEPCTLIKNGSNGTPLIYSLEIIAKDLGSPPPLEGT